jgi:hypothetical protein
VRNGAALRVPLLNFKEKQSGKSGNTLRGWADISTHKNKSEQEKRMIENE